MTARDRMTENVSCKQCGTEGLAKFSQEDGWSFMRDQSTRVDFLPDGFSYSGGSGIQYPVRFFVPNADLTEEIDRHAHR